MKKLTFILGSAAAVIALAVAAPALTSCNNATQNETAAPDSTITRGPIVFFNLDRVLAEYDMANDLTSVVQTKVESIQQEINRRGSKIDRDMQALQDKMNKGTITQSTAEEQYRKIQQAQASFQQYAAQKDQEMNEELAVTQNSILDAINTYVQSYNEAMGYEMILATQGGLLSVPVVCGSASLDITDEIIAGLNAAYVADKDKAE